MLDNIDLTSTQTSESTHTANLDRASVSIEWSGSDAVGTIEFEAKKAKKDVSTPELDWTTLDFGATIDITGASGNHEIIFDALDFTDLRVKFNSTSGTVGNLSAVLTAKQIGG
jgi:hypothetical protein